ncbi:hypothetical protein FHT08_002938 [Xanthomonas campestris]|nr:hypothetical protein [Xanthomonas sp. CFBP 8151]
MQTSIGFAVADKLFFAPASPRVTIGGPRKRSSDARTKAQDAPGRLLQAMQVMQTQIRSLMSARSNMAKRHDEGQTGFRMDAQAFPGDYGRKAEATNTLVASHLAVQSNLARIMGRYAIGEPSESMERLPGEKAVLSQTMDEVKANLSARNIEIKQLAQAAAIGDFTARGDADRFQYDFRIMVERLNLLMATADSNLQSLSSLLHSSAAGDLTARMTGEFKGVFAQMRNDANTTAAQLAEIVGRVGPGTWAHWVLIRHIIPQDQAMATACPALSCPL